MNFIPSLELSRMLFTEQIRPTLEKEFPGLEYAAATLGMCSEVLGLDDEVSLDHEWGPRVTLFLNEQDKARLAQEIHQVMQGALPESFKGFPMMWRKPGVGIHDTRETALYHVWVTTAAESLGNIGIKRLPLEDLDWLKISEQHLCEFTAGVVYRDDTGELTRARDLLRYYSDDVLRFLLRCEWNAVGGDWFPIGRIGSRGDELGLRLQAAKIAQRFMRIAFMVSRTYATYKKWFGTLFMRLPIAAELQPRLLDLLEEKRWQQVEEKIGGIADVLLAQQNRLGIAPRVTLKKTKAHDGRHYINYDFWRIGNLLAGKLQPPLKTLMENEVFFMDDRSLILWNEEVGKWILHLQK